MKITMYYTYLWEFKSFNYKQIEGSILLDYLSIFIVFMHFSNVLFPRNPETLTVF